MPSIITLIVSCPNEGPDICDTIDNDCNPGTLDGSDEPDYGLACDGHDADMCLDGEFLCDSGVMTCSDIASEPEFVEMCDGADNDCNPDTADGADEPTLGEACDGTDPDLLMNGVVSCVSGALECVE